MPYSLDFALALGASNQGLALEGQIVDTTGANVGAAITTGFVEFGGAGQYLWHTTAIPDGHRGGVIFRISGGGAVKAFAAVNPQESENPDVKTSTRSSHTAADVWASGTRTLTSFGTLVADIWANTSRTLSAFAFSVTVGTNNDKTGYALSAAGVQAIWDALTTALTTAGSIGKRLADNIDAAVSSRSSHTAADVWAVATRTLSAFSFSVDILQSAADKVWLSTSRTLTGLGTLAGAVAAAVWDEGRAAHVALGSFGIGTPVIRDGMAQSGTATTIQLDAGASSLSGFYNFNVIGIKGGTGAGQGNIIASYAGATKTATVSMPWVVAPDATSVFVIIPLGAIPGATAPSAAQIATSVWSEPVPGAFAAGTAGLALGAELSEMHGLLGQHSGLRNTVYSGVNLVSYDLCLYSSSGAALTNDGVTGLTHKYSVANTYDGSNNLLTSSTVRVS